MNHWIYKSSLIKGIQDCPEGAIGFIYKITGPGNKIYIGKKILVHTRKAKISKKEKLQTKTRKKFKQVKSDSDWLNYFGSSKELLEDIQIKGKEKFTRTILEFCFCKAQLSYKEVKYMFEYNVLEIDSYNANILSRFFRQTPTCGT